MMQPTLHKGCSPNSDAIARLGRMWPTKALGKPGTTTSQVWVDCTWQPFGRFTVKGWVVRRQLGTGTPSFINTEVAPVSAIPCESSMSIVVSCAGDEMLNATTVALSSTTVVHFNNNWVEFREAETKSLNLCAVNTSAPPHHMGARNGPVGN